MFKHRKNFTAHVSDRQAIGSNQSSSACVKRTVLRRTHIALQTLIDCSIFTKFLISECLFSKQARPTKQLAEAEV